MDNIENEDVGKKEVLPVDTTPTEELLPETVESDDNDNGIIRDEEFFDENYSDDSLIGGNYQEPTSKEGFIDTGDGRVIDKKELSPFEIIKAVAKQNNHPIREPRSGCKHCYGRGYIGKDYKTQMPIPCSCIYLPKTPAEKAAERPQMFLNHDARRRMEKALRRDLKSGKLRLKKVPKTENTTEEQVDITTEKDEQNAA